jgi:hypothetical protein
MTCCPWPRQDAARSCPLHCPPLRPPSARAAMPATWVASNLSPDILNNDARLVDTSRSSHATSLKRGGMAKGSWQQRCSECVRQPVLRPCLDTVTDFNCIGNAGWLGQRLTCDLSSRMSSLTMPDTKVDAELKVFAPEDTVGLLRT